MNILFKLHLKQLISIYSEIDIQKYYYILLCLLFFKYYVWKNKIKILSYYK